MASSGSDQQPTSSDQEQSGATPAGGIGQAAEEAGVVDQQAVLQDQIEESGADQSGPAGS